MSIIETYKQVLLDSVKSGCCEDLSDEAWIASGFKADLMQEIVNEVGIGKLIDILSRTTQIEVPEHGNEVGAYLNARFLARLVRTLN